MPRTLLITAPPRTGKSTLVKRILHETLGERRGFYTEEVMYAGERVGFRVIPDFSKSPLERAIFAHTTYDCPKVGKYGVDVAKFEAVLLTLSSFDRDDYRPFLYIDEIGAMQLQSKVLFPFLVDLYLEARNPFIATIPSPEVYDNPYLRQIKARSDVEVRTISRETWLEDLAYIRSFVIGPN